MAGIAMGMTATALVAEAASRDSRRQWGFFLSGANEDHKEQQKDKMAHSARKRIRARGSSHSSVNGRLKQDGSGRLDTSKSEASEEVHCRSNSLNFYGGCGQPQRARSVCSCQISSLCERREREKQFH
jgi:hypothetical protein